ncbi:MAG: XRE family transcriptional regulator [Elusimicrobiaceae bacterium]
MRLGEKIEKLLKQNKMTKTELASKMGLRDSSVISHWVKNRFKPDRTNLVKLAAVFDMKESYFTDEAEESESHRIIDEAEKRLHELLREAEEKTTPKRIIHVGVIGTVSAENFNFAFENSPEEYLPVLVEAYGGKHIFALKIRGACMSPTAEDGDYAIVAQTSHVDDGRLAVVRLNCECTLKRIFRKQNVIELKPDNEKFKTLRIKPSELEIVGQVVGFFRKP